MGQTVRIEIDRDVCVGSRICSAIAPKVFDIGTDGQAKVVDPQADAPSIIRAAAEACPVSAITFTIEAKQQESDPPSSRQF